MQLPDKISGFRSKPINELIDFCQSLQPVVSKTIRHNWTSNGVSSEVARQSEYTGPDYHFAVDQSAAAGVKVHGGTWTRRFCTDVTAVSLTVSSGTGSDYSGLSAGLTVTADTGYVLLVLDDRYIPTKLTAEYAEALPTDDDLWIKRPIAKITSVSAGGGPYITAIEQMHVGDIDDTLDVLPDYVGAGDTLATIFVSDDTAGKKRLSLYGSAAVWTGPKFPILDKDNTRDGALEWIPPDADAHGYGAGTLKSIQISGGTLQLYGFAGATGGYVPIKGETSGALEWIVRGVPYPSNCGKADAVPGTTGIAFADHTHKITSAATADTATYATTAGYAYMAGTVANLPSHSHADHIGLVAPADDHTQYLLLSGNAARNAMSGVIANSAGTGVIDPNLQTLTGSWTVTTDLHAGGIVDAGTCFSVANSKMGLGISDWFDGGILTGATVVAKHIRTLDLDTGMPINGTVLMIPD